MTDFYDGILGLEASFSKTVSESDVYLFAGITGDFSPNHVDAEFMRRTQYGQRIAHGALLVGYMSRASTMIADKCGTMNSSLYPVSLGYDKTRFLKPVFINDTISVTYTIASCDRRAEPLTGKHRDDKRPRRDCRFGDPRHEMAEPVVPLSGAQ